MRARPAVAAALLSLLAAGAALAAPATPAASRSAFPGASSPWTVDDLVGAERAEGWTVSPDGRLVAWAQSEVEEVEDEEKRVSNLWLRRIETRESAPLTRGLDRATRPAFSPDSRFLAFLSTRKPPGGEDEDDLGDTQVWAIPVGGGEAEPVTRFDRDVLDAAWIDADTLLVLAEESPTAREREREEADDAAIVVDDADEKPPVRLFTVSRDGETVRRLSVEDDWVDSVAVSPDGRWAVLTAQQSLSYEFDSRVPPHAYLVDLSTGARRRLLEDGVLLPHTVRWALDAAGFYFANERTRHPLYRMATVTDLHYHDLASGEVTRIDLGTDRGLGGDYRATPDGFVALLHEGVRYRPARFVRRGTAWTRRDLSGTHVKNLDEWALGKDGRTLVYLTSSATTPPQGWVARLDGDRIVGERRITDLNSGWKGKPTGRAEVLRWTGARGETVEGILYYPLDWQEGERRPLILDIHGGPAAEDRDTWGAGWGVPGLLWRQRGAFILQANYHGSRGYGLDWVESIEKNYYTLEIPDLEAGVDHVIARGLADPERLASAGWSNGGILTAELITRTRRYKAAMVGAADVEWISDWGNVDFGASFDNYYFGAPPWEAPEVYIEKSPFFRLTEVTTPTIVFTGTEDRNVPPHQSWSLFRALQQIGKAPSRLVLFPGEPHGLRKVAHQRRQIEETVAWFDRYLFEKAPDPLAASGAVPKGSALAALLARARAARTDGVFGRRAGAALVPETVPFEGLEVGRFEVTRAQYAAFDPAYSVEPGTADLPATGVGFEQAKRYAEWLATATGRPFRLPTVKEAEALAEKGEGDGEGNTLDRWAGYTPNPKDRAAIRRALEAAAPVAGEAPLLQPVGSHPGAGDDPVFDLDGNAAEWAVAEDGKGQPVGPSADRPEDPRSNDQPPAAYVGLRVVVGAGDGAEEVNGYVVMPSPFQGLGDIGGLFLERPGCMPAPLRGCRRVRLRLRTTLVWDRRPHFWYFGSYNCTLNPPGTLKCVTRP